MDIITKWEAWDENNFCNLQGYLTVFKTYFLPSTFLYAQSTEVSKTEWRSEEPVS